MRNTHGGVLNVQESIDNVNAGLTPLYDPKKTMYIYSKTQQGEVVNISGSGKLYICCYIFNRDDSSSYITIVADDITYKTKQIGISSSAYMFLQGYYSRAGIDAIRDIRNNSSGLDLQHDYLKTIGQDTVGSVLYSVKPLTFKNNLKITVNRGSGYTAELHILYELAE